MMGAMALSSAVEESRTGRSSVCRGHQVGLSWPGPGWEAPTDEDEADGDNVGEHVATDGLVVLPVALPKEAYERVELVLAEALRGERCERHRAVPSTSLRTVWGRGHGPALTWKTLGAETRQANAEDRVAPKIPAVMRGPNPDTMLMLCPRTQRSGPPCIILHPTLKDFQPPVPSLSAAPFYIRKKAAKAASSRA